MATSFNINRAEKTKLRRLPLLPRFGLTLEFGGRQFTWKMVPFLETVLNWRDAGFTMQNFRKVSAEELSEITFPRNSAPTGRSGAALRSIRSKVSGSKAEVRSKKVAGKAP